MKKAEKSPENKTKVQTNDKSTDKKSSKDESDSDSSDSDSDSEWTLKCNAQTRWSIAYKYLSQIIANTHNTY